MARHYIRHHYLNDSLYFVTVHTVKKQRFLQSNEIKRIVFKTICDFFQRYNYQLYAWAILDDHYHLLFKTRIGNDFKKLFLMLRDHCLANIKQELKLPIKKTLFFNLFDVCLQTKNDFFLYFNYIHENPVKHKYVEQAGDYLFSSYRFWEWRRNRKWMEKCYESFPSHNLILKEDENLFEKNRSHSA